MYQVPKGTSDILPEQQFLWNFIKDQAKEIEEQEKRIKEMESKNMTQYREIKVTVLALDNKEDDQQSWLFDAITDAIVTTEGERITSFEIGQPFEK